MKPIISICIPNYNRASYLSQNLNQIGKQINSQVQIVVSDDASSEAVDSVILEFKKKFPKAKIKYQRQEKNLGFDRNVIRVIDLADGKYCWLLSNDDKILPGSVNKILGVIDSNRDLSHILINYKRFDHSLSKTTSSRMVNIKRDLHFNDADEFYFLSTPNSYFKILGINTLTMSCDIFRRDVWLKSIPKIMKYVGHNFIHVFALTTLIKNSPSIYFISTPQVQYLSNNHRVWPNLIWHDYRHKLLSHMMQIGYNKKLSKKLRDSLKQDEINERLWTAGQRTGLYQRFFPLIRKIRLLFGHHI